MPLFKKHKMVLIPTGESPKVGQVCINNICAFIWSEEHESQNVIASLPEYKTTRAYNLHVISNDDVRPGDWYVHEQASFGRRALKCIQFLPIDSKKIIATTDTLNSEYKIMDTICSFIVPAVSKSFVDEYIDCYNNGNIITEAELEYESFHGVNTSIAEASFLSGNNDYNWKGRGDNRDFRLKVDVNSGAVFIKKAKDAWNKQEVEALIKKAISDAEDESGRYLLDHDKWIEDNL